MTLGAVGTVFTLDGHPGRHLAALLVGSMAAATVHLLFGSPGGRPSLAEVAAALRDLGVDARDLRPAELQPAGVWTVLGEGAAGEPLVIKVYGRDAWDTQLVTQTWRFLWYRHSSARLRLSRASARWSTRRCSCCSARSASIDGAEGAGRRRARGRRQRCWCSSPSPSRGRVGGLDRAVDARWRPPTTPACRRARSTSTTSGGRRRVTASSTAGRAAPPHPRRCSACRTERSSSIATAGHARAATRRSTRRRRPSATTAPPRSCPTSRSRRCRRAMRRRVDDLDDTIEDLRDELSDALAIEQPELVQLRRVTVGVGRADRAARAGRCPRSSAPVAGLDLAAVADEVQDLTLGRRGDLLRDGADRPASRASSRRWARPRCRCPSGRWRSSSTSSPTSGSPCRAPPVGSR